MESSLEIGFLRASEKAAIAAARTMGYGKRKYSDQVAVEAMREELNKLKMRGAVVIGEGERDKAPTNERRVHGAKGSEANTRRQAGRTITAGFAVGATGHVT